MATATAKMATAAAPPYSRIDFPSENITGSPSPVSVGSRGDLGDSNFSFGSGVETERSSVVSAAGGSFSRAPVMSTIGGSGTGGGELFFSSTSDGGDGAASVVVTAEGMTKISLSSASTSSSSEDSCCCCCSTTAASSMTSAISSFSTWTMSELDELFSLRSSPPPLLSRLFSSSGSIATCCQDSGPREVGRLSVCQEEDTARLSGGLTCSEVSLVRM
ncbi:hypothetical protein GDO81_023467 [Engystomops pustulosus]|uniref:Uncharacterized protein n=1 Tax=Engystomops pustulosus TaxID=76066 RepID=A0AAV6YRZ1_ENGPU|nr:hypothetical protein GDO81_023467 [Engystomops pustulosus]